MSVRYPTSFILRYCKRSGLPAALSSYCEEFSRVRGLPVSCETDESVKELSPRAALCLYRDSSGSPRQCRQTFESHKRLRFELSRPMVAFAFLFPTMA